MKYIKKPIPVDAWQIDVLEIEHQGNIPDWVADALESSKIKMSVDKHSLCILTLEGMMTADEGDYLIRGPKGEFWFNKRDIFEEMYEPVDI
jgi:hypothetical protein